MAVAKTSYASPATETTGFFDALPDELVLKIVTMAATKLYVDNIELGYGTVRYPPRTLDGTWYYDFLLDHDFLLEVLFRVSQRFRRLAKDPSLWKGSVVISPDARYPGKADFVVRQCFHRGTTHLILRGAYEDGARVILCNDPVSMFPSLNFLGEGGIEFDGERCLLWATRKEEESDEETA